MTKHAPLSARDEAIVLRRIPFGDTSLVVHLFSRDRGRVPMLVKGAFRAKSPYFGSFDLLNRLDVELLAGKEGALALPASARLIDHHPLLRSHRPALLAALYAGELVDGALTESPQPELFEHFQSFLGWLSAEPHAPAAIAGGLVAFEFRFLDDLGLRPVLDRCTECGKDAADFGAAFAFSVHAGGILCEECRPRATDARGLQPATRVDALALRDGSKPAIASAQLRELRGFLDAFLRYYLDDLPRSRPSIEELWH